jgi:hypothetical protein
MGASRTFNGSSSDVDFGDQDLMDGASEYTAMSWINTDQTSTAFGIYTKWSSTNKPFHFDAGAKLSTNIGDGNTTTQRVFKSTANYSTMVSTGVWHHFTCQNSLTSNSVQKTYLNGSSQAGSITFNSTTGSTIQANTAELHVGSFAGSTLWMDGSLAYSAIYDSLLDIDAIKEVTYQPFAFIPLSIVPLWDSGSSEYEIGNNYVGTNTSVTENFDGPPVFLLGGQ